MKKLLLIPALLATNLLLGQNIGINVPTPLSELHVGGDVSLNSSINVEASQTNKGNPGQPGDVLVSKGEHLSPTWQSIDAVLTPKVYFARQTEDLPLPAGFGAPWLDIPGLELDVEIPKGKKALITIISQVCIIRVHDTPELAGISIGIKKDNEMLISNTSQISHREPYGAEYIVVPIFYSEFIDATDDTVKITYKASARSNYVSSSDKGPNPIKITNNPHDRKDYTELRITSLIF